MYYDKYDQQHYQDMLFGKMATSVQMVKEKYL